MNKTSSTISSNFCLCKKILPTSPHVSYNTHWKTIFFQLIIWGVSITLLKWFGKEIWRRLFFPSILIYFIIISFWDFSVSPFFFSLSSFPIAFIITIRRKEKKSLNTILIEKNAHAKKKKLKDQLFLYWRQEYN